MNVTLHLLTSKEQITEKAIVEIFTDSGVLKAFRLLSEDKREAILEKITSIKSEDKQVKTILKFTEELNKKND
ncbi:MAG: hypothetical protein RLZZ546_1578 [Bacteroidota bacterium]